MEDDTETSTLRKPGRLLVYPYIEILPLELIDETTNPLRETEHRE